MTEQEMLRRIGNGEPVEDVMDEHLSQQRESLRSTLADLGPRGIHELKRYDAVMREVDSGVWTARNVWRSISGVQQKALTIVSRKDGSLVRRTQKPSVYSLPSNVELLCRVATVRKLCAHNLLAWNGGAFDPEAAAVITERGQFVVRHGPTPVAR